MEDSPSETKVLDPSHCCRLLASSMWAVDSKVGPFRVEVADLIHPNKPLQPKQKS